MKKAYAAMSKEELIGTIRRMKKAHQERDDFHFDIMSAEKRRSEKLVQQVQVWKDLYNFVDQLHKMVKDDAEYWRKRSFYYANGGVEQQPEAKPRHAIPEGWSVVPGGVQD